MDLENPNPFLGQEKKRTKSCPNDVLIRHYSIKFLITSKTKPVRYACYKLFLIRFV